MSKLQSSTITAMIRSRNLLHLRHSHPNIKPPNRLLHPLLLLTNDERQSSSVVHHRPYHATLTTGSRCFDSSYHHQQQQQHSSNNTIRDMNTENRRYRNQTNRTALSFSTSTKPIPTTSITKTSNDKLQQQSPEPIVLY